MPDPHDELADADVISGGGADFGAFAASRWPKLARRARWAVIPVLAGAVAAAALLAPHPHFAARLTPRASPR